MTYPVDLRRNCLSAAVLLLLVACVDDGTRRTQDPADPDTPVEHRLTVQIAGSGAGHVQSTPVGIDCGLQCSAVYAEGTAVSLRATPVADATFAGWSGACTGTAACIVTMDRERLVGARFESLPAGAPEGLWLSGDLHVHDDHSSDGSGPRQLADDRGPGNVAISDQLRFAETLGLDFLPLTDHRTYDQHYDPTWRSAALLLIPGEEANGSPHATVHGAVDTVVQGGGEDLRRLQQSIWAAHGQAAVWITAHPDDGELDDAGLPNARAQAVGIDLVETWNRASNVEREIDYAEERWNAGYRFGIAGASDNHFRELWLAAGPGMPTTRVFAAARRERALLDGLAAGRTRLSSDPFGPQVRLEADFQNDGVFEALGGDEVFVPANRAFTLRVVVENALGSTVQVYAAPGRSAGPLASFSPSLPELEASYELPLVTGSAPSWYRVEVRGFGPPQAYDTTDVPVSAIPPPQNLPDQLRATSSPIFVSPAPVAAAGEAQLPADSGLADGAELALGDAGLFAGFPDLAVAGTRQHLVAEQHDRDGTHILYRRRLASGAWSEPQTLSHSGAARFAKVAARGDAVWVVWQDEAAGQQPRQPAIHLRRSSDGGVSWAEPELLRGGSFRAEHPALALTPDGAAVVAWQEIREGEPFDVFVQVLGRDELPLNLSREGKSFSAADPLDSRSARYPASVWPAVAVADDGRITVAWQDNRDDPDPLWTGSAFNGEGTDPDNWQVVLRSRAAGSATWQAALTLGAADRADRHPTLAYDAGGVLVLAWDSRPLQSSGADPVVLATHSLAAGGFAAPAPVAAGTQGMGLHPRLGRDASGTVEVVWSDSRSADWRWRILRARRMEGVWNDAALIPSRGNNQWPVTAGGAVAFAGTRGAQRLQRDRTQQIFWLGAPQAPLAAGAP
ncbi:MAG TPA: CehA/McbA family metallohydrolase [Solimonas sp.]|nr:CehA/McbA family metallohydrolase [Solimonas sp.]